MYRFPLVRAIIVLAPVVLLAWALIAQAATPLELMGVSRPPAEPDEVCPDHEATAHFTINLIDRTNKNQENLVTRVADQEYTIDAPGGLITRIIGFNGFTMTPAPLPQSRVTLKRSGLELCRGR